MIIFVFVTMLSCSEKRKINENIITENLSIASIVDSDNVAITEGNTFFTSGDYDTAIEYYKDAMQLNKATAFYNIGVSYYLLNNIPQAELNFKEAVNADPNFDEAVMNLVAVLAQQEKVKEAETYISKLVRTNKSPRVYTDMANISLRLGDVAKAAYYYKQALDMDKTSTYVISNYANFLISIGAYQDGINLLDGITNKDFTINYNIANAYFKLDQTMPSYTYASDALFLHGATEEGYDKLAYLFFDLKKYADETKALQILISKNPSREYKLRLITSYVNQLEYSKALDEITALLREYPKDVTLNMLYYEILILDAKILDAGRFIRQAYKNLGGDTVLYYYTKHLAIFEKLTDEVKNRIFVNRDNGWINLARTVYLINAKKYADAKKYLDKVTDAIGHDYYAYKTFLYIIDNNFKEAEITSDKMLSTAPDTFWYKLVIAWNMNQVDTILELSNKFKNDTTAMIRTPTFTYTLIPHIDDMAYTFKFNDTGADIASMLAYPIFLNPDEVVQFLIMGRATLKDTEKELTTKKLEGMKRNNEGVDAFYAYDFDKAAKKFREAELLLPNNSFVTYNLGLAYFNIGDNILSRKTFSKALVQDKANPFISFGIGLLDNRLGDKVSANYNFDTARKLSETSLQDSLKPDINNIRLIYLALLASDRFGRLDEAKAIVKSNDAIVSAVERFIRFTDSYDEKILIFMEDSPVFRVEEVKTLLNLRFKKATDIVNIQSTDKYFELAFRYVLMRRGINLPLTPDEKYATDKVYLKDMVYYSIINNDKATALKFLQILSNMDFKYAELYKASLYYFIWINDYVNAEASVGSLDRMGYQDKLSQFYITLFSLVNFNENRLRNNLKIYVERYTSDYRSSIITAILNLNTRNIGGFHDIMNRLLKENPELFKKMFIEVNFAKF